MLSCLWWPYIIFLIGLIISSVNQVLTFSHVDFVLFVWVSDCERTQYQARIRRVTFLFWCFFHSLSLFLRNSQECCCDSPCEFQRNTSYLTLNYLVSLDLWPNSGNNAQLSSAKLCLRISLNTKLDSQRPEHTIHCITSQKTHRTSSLSAIETLSCSLEQKLHAQPELMLKCCLVTGTYAT